ncbi:hypothetical protein EGS47_01660 [Acinetobacter sp. FDAARGOS_515]|nr:hypothetical protein EGS47_01660 [Acinetobacter sp. FDAARGOS_515]
MVHFSLDYYREGARAGNARSLFVTPVRPLEIVLSKLIPYIVIGMIDIVMCLLAASLILMFPFVLITFDYECFIFIFIGFIVIGLTISGFSSSQFQASQIAYWSVLCQQ